MLAHFTKRSSNAKTGPLPVTMTEAASCPTSCPFKGAGCYAENFPLKLHWSRVATQGITWDALCASIAALPAGQLWRHNVAGDLPGEGEAIDREALLALVNANHGRKGFTYTHKPMTPVNANTVRLANNMGFTINLSANSLPHADMLAALAVAPVVVVLPLDAPRTQTTPKGRTVVTCPATYREDVTCASCGLCQNRSPSRAIVGFPAHGARARKASTTAKGQ